ncbi:MAG: helix-turn-helix domain-containing protein [Defluviitaleaceae bacterium]|nr:helix-turn-helix domain-containing protein [Defluviitaleaceae bacterium]
MKITIGNKIKSLRNKHSVTQERLAECLGITAQAVSRWESEICYPDIELLPSIADFFNVTVDELLCFDLNKREAKIHDYIKEGHAKQNDGEFDYAVDIFRSALREFPSSYLLHAELACAIACMDNGQKISQALCDETIELCLRIFQTGGCTDENFRLRAKHIMGWIYAKHLENSDKAMQIASGMPTVERTLFMAETLKFYPPHPESVANIINIISVLLILFGNNLGYQVEKHLQESINALTCELEWLKSNMRLRVKLEYGASAPTPTSPQ